MDRQTGCRKRYEMDNLIRQTNLDRVRRAIRVTRKATKPQLARQTGLSVVTVNALVEALVAAGEIIVEDPALTTGGRPAATYAFNERFQLALAIHTGEFKRQDAVHAEVVDLLGAVIDQEVTALDEISEAAIDQLIERMLARYTTIRAIGIGLPGLVINGRLAVDYAALDGRDLVAHLQQRFQMPVVFENDVNAAVLGFCTASPDRGHSQTVVGIYLPEKYPPGAGICIDGRIHEGRNGFAGEVKFLQGPVDWTKPAAVARSLIAAVANLIIAFTCILNPDVIVLYRQNISGLTIDAILDKCRQIVRAELLPEIIASDHFQADFADGIRQIAIEALEPHAAERARKP